MTKFRCYNIVWDTETEDGIPAPTDQPVAVGMPFLPTELVVELSEDDMLATEDDEAGRSELICNKLSDETDWLVQSYCCEQL